MARGAEEKAIVEQKILDLFGSSAFKYDKDIRVNIGEEQIKISLTRAAAPVQNSNGGEAAIKVNNFPDPVEKEPVQATESELQAVADLMKALDI